MSPSWSKKITVEGYQENVVHRNLVLVRADSPDEAYEKAMSLGRESEDTYENPVGLNVRTVFHGLGMLNVVHDELEHGAELLYQESVGVQNEQLASWVLPKEQLAVFRPNEPTTGPDYSCGVIVREAERLLRESSE